MHYVSGEQGIDFEESSGLHPIYEEEELCAPAGH
jgi:hypothetical protein